MVKHKLNMVLLGIGILVLIFVLANIEYKQLSLSYIKLSYKTLLIPILIVIFFLARALRWIALLRASKIRLPFAQAYLMNTVSLVFALYSPAQTGDVLKLQFLKNKYNVSRRISLATVIIEKMQDFILVSVIFVLSAAYFGLLKLKISLVVVAAIFIFGLVVAAIAISIKKIKLVRTILNSFKTISSNASLLISSVFLTLASWCISVFIWVLVAETVGLQPSFIEMSSIIAGTAVAIVVTFIPGAIGSMEVSNILLVKVILGATTNQAIVFAFAIRLLTVILFAFGYLHLLIKSKIDNTARKT